MTSPSPPVGSPGPAAEQVRLTCWLTGQVQGVGMRWWVRSRALELGLTGWAANRSDGRVEVVAEGRRDTCGHLLEVLRSGDGPGQITSAVARWSPSRGVPAGFRER